MAHHTGSDIDAAELVGRRAQEREGEAGHRITFIVFLDLLGFFKGRCTRYECVTLQSYFY